jgi:ketosteroid isomerase-like protein
MTTQTTGIAAGSHPFTAALAARDIDALIESLAPDPVAHSAITGIPFRGQEIVADLYRSLFDALDDLRMTDEFHEGDTHAFFWEGHIGGRYVAGADRLRIDAEGKVREVTIVGRPLTGLSAFVTDIGFHLARRRRGIVVARILRLVARPLAPMFWVLERVGAWVARGSGPRR